MKYEYAQGFNNNRANPSLIDSKEFSIHCKLKGEDFQKLYNIQGLIFGVGYKRKFDNYEYAGFEWRAAVVLSYLYSVLILLNKENPKYVLKKKWVECLEDKDTFFKRIKPFQDINRIDIDQDRFDAFYNATPDCDEKNLENVICIDVENIKTENGMRLDFKFTVLSNEDANEIPQSNLISDKVYQNAFRMVTKVQNKKTKLYKTTKGSICNNLRGGSNSSYCVMDFLLKLDDLQKLHGNKTQRYEENFYYQTIDGELACIKPKHHTSGKAWGELLMRRGKIDKKTRRARVPIDGKPETYGIMGTIVKHNRILEELKGQICDITKGVLSKAFDKTKECYMVIDKDFHTAYDEKYKDCASYAGDLCTSSSCMSDRGSEAQDFYGSIPCCKVVRFMTKEAPCEQVGRCIVYYWKRKRHFIRVYGRREYLPRMYSDIKAFMRPGDLFGRNEYFDDLECLTSINGETSNMYLDGSYYGFIYDNNLDACIMCSKFNYDDVAKKNGITDYMFLAMKETNDGTVNVEGYNCTCEHCGERFNDDDDDAIICEAGCYCCSDCANKENVYYCDYHYDWEFSEQWVFFDGHCYCDAKAAENAGYAYCDSCGEWENSEYVYYVEAYNECWCTDRIHEAEKDGVIVETYDGNYILTENAVKIYYDGDFDSAPEYISKHDAENGEIPEGYVLEQEQETKEEQND